MKRGKRIKLDSMEKKFTVYLLYYDEEIVYIGKSFISAEGRIQHHMENSDKVFDSYELIECTSEQEMNILEAEMIFKHIPKYNKQLPTKHSSNLFYIGPSDMENTKLKIDAIVLKGKVYIKVESIKENEED